MRSREEIESSVSGWNDGAMAPLPSSHTLGNQDTIIELLLDIRDLLSAQDARPAVTHPKSPPAPEVKL